VAVTISTYFNYLILGNGSVVTTAYQNTIHVGVGFYAHLRRWTHNYFDFGIVIIDYCM
jgi:hypothetical protein